MAAHWILQTLQSPRTANFPGACISGERVSPRGRVSKESVSPRSVFLQGECVSQERVSPRRVCLPGVCVSQECVNFSDLIGSKLRPYEMGVVTDFVAPENRLHLALETKHGGWS
jgi:hypothetical protein